VCAYLFKFLNVELLYLTLCKSRLHIQGHLCVNVVYGEQAAC